MLEELIEKINKIEANVNLLLELHLEQSNNLTTYNDVAKFLGKTRKTIYNYIKDGKFIEENIIILMTKIPQHLFHLASLSLKRV